MTIVLRISQQNLFRINVFYVLIHRSELILLSSVGISCTKAFVSYQWGTKKK